jgi:hypothetical protein
MLPLTALLAPYAFAAKVWSTAEEHVRSFPDLATGRLAVDAAHLVSGPIQFGVEWLSLAWAAPVDFWRGRRDPS